MNIVQQLLNYLQTFSTTDWVIGAICLLLMALILLLRQYQACRDLVESAVRTAESKFNSGEGQQKLDYAISYIIQYSPKYIKWLITKESLKPFLVTCIEKVLAEISSSFGNNNPVDIKGNEPHQ